MKHVSRHVLRLNIKSLNTQPIVPVDPKSRVEGKSRTQASADRDGNGRRERKEPEIKRHLTDQEFDEALKVLEEMPGFKSNSLAIKVETVEDHRLILVVDPAGQIVRRLSEAQLWAATRDKDRQTGRILDKAM